MKKIKDKFAKKEYQSIIGLSNNYASIHDKELIEAGELAKKRYKEFQTKKLLAYLKSTSPKNKRESQKIYTLLLQFHPKNRVYQKKLAFYNDEIKEERRREKEINEQFNPWDDSHYNLEQSIKKTMTHPESYQHIYTRYSEKKDHLLVTTTYHGKNRLNKPIKSTITAKITLYGKIEKIVSQSYD